MTLFGLGPSDPPQITANQGIAASRDFRDNTLNVYNHHPDLIAMLMKLYGDVTASADARREAEVKAAELAGQLNRANVAAAQVLAFVRILAGETVTPEQLPGKMAEITSNYLHQQQQIALLQPRDNEAADLVDRAKLASAAGRFTEADHLLEQAEDRETAAIAEHQIKAAELRAARGDNAATQLHYADAATYYENAAALLPPGHLNPKGRYLLQAADALQTHGDQRGDNAALSRSITLYCSALADYPRDCDPLNWAMIQNNLGSALQTLGARKSDTATLQQAVKTFGLAFLEFTQTRVPLDWAMTQNNLGNALSALGELETGTATLQQAVKAFRLALQEYTLDRCALAWAAIQNNLGFALGILGERETGTDTLQQAVEACSLALQEHTRVRVPLRWAMTQKNLGRVQRLIGERTSSPEAFTEALACLKDARAVYAEAGHTHRLLWFDEEVAATEASRAAPHP